MKKYRAIAVAWMIALLAVAASGCLIQTDDTKQAALISGDSVPVVKEAMAALDDQPFEDNAALYATGGGDSVVTMYLTVSRGSVSENTDHTWKEINSHSIYDYWDAGIPRAQAEGLLQVGDENGPVAGQLGFGSQVPNATVQIRGATSSREPQKSYKIELTASGAQWRGQRTIDLNKHVSDGLRFRNMLAYELLQQIPGQLSLRTQFVHLYVKDETEGAGKGFVDYGLYTQVEQVNKKLLRNHGLDENGQLYKLNFFEFYAYKEAIKLKNDPTYDQSEFEELLEIKGSDDHTKLIEMLDAVNNFTIPIDQTFEKYFDADNYLTLKAFNILMGNIDSVSRNTAIYSPKNGRKWYVFNWDCDASLFRDESGHADVEGVGYEHGMSNYWNDMLFNRLMRLPQYQKLLSDKVEELHKFITPERIRAMAAKYRKTVEPYLSRMPDIEYAKFTPQEYDQMITKVANETTANYLEYKLSLTQPMPFYLSVPQVEDGDLSYRWNSAYTLDGQNVHYSFELSKDYLFQDVITRQEGLQIPAYTTEKLPPGKYFYRVAATNEQGKTQYAMSYYVVENVKYYGVLCFYVREDGSIVEDVAHE